MLTIVSWIGLGAAIGVIWTAPSADVFPAGRVGALVAGAAGAFVGGGVVAVVADRSIARFNFASLAAAAVAAVLVLAATRRAQYAEPRPQ